MRSTLSENKTCGKKHIEEYRKIGITNYKCNQKGHYASEFPSAQLNGTCYKYKDVEQLGKDCKTVIIPANAMLRIEATPAAIQPRTRTFNMIIKDVAKDFGMVVGTLPINSVNAKVLIDSKATKSFISKDFA